jgi:hypothetical protein
VAVPVGLGGDGRAEELRNVEKKLARGLVGGEDERRRGSAWRWLDGNHGARGGIEPSLDFFRAFFEINIFVFIIVSRVV